MIFYVYVDWTTELTPRAFYVGKGIASRVAKVQRNPRHNAIRIAYGMKREIMISTTVEKISLDVECELIAELKTRHDTGWGANYTDGGEGVSGLHHSDETKKRLGTCFAGENNPMYGKKHSKEVRASMSKSQRGKTLSEKHRANMKLAHVGKSSPNKGKRMTPERLAKYIETRRLRRKSK